MNLRLSCVALFCSGLLSCIPVGDEPDPKGAVLVAFEPSAAARGEPFVSSDGWIVRVKTLALSAQVTVWQDRDGTSTGRGVLNVWNGALRSEAVARALPAEEGTAKAKFWSASFFDFVESGRSRTEWMEALARDGMPVEVANQLLPDSCEDGCPVPPSVVLVLEATRGDQKMTVDLAIRKLSVEMTSTGRVVVRRDELSRTTVDVRPEIMFGEGVPRGQLGVFVNLDTNGDGHVDDRELHAPVTSSGVICKDWSPEECESMYGRLTKAATQMLVFR